MNSQQKFALYLLGRHVTLINKLSLDSLTNSRCIPMPESLDTEIENFTLDFGNFLKTSASQHFL